MLAALGALAVLAAPTAAQPVLTGEPLAAPPLPGLAALVLETGAAGATAPGPASRDSGPAPATRRTLAWGAALASARAAGLACQAAGMDDQIPGSPLAVTAKCSLGPAGRWRVGLPVLEGSAWTVAPGPASALYFNKYGLYALTIDLTSGREIAAARAALEQRRAAGVVAQIGSLPAPDGESTFFCAPHATLDLFASHDKPGGSLQVSYAPPPQEPVFLDDRSPPAVRSGTKVRPVYPEAARRARFAGHVLLRVAVDKQGNVVRTEVIQHLPFGLDSAAENAVRRWKFEPTLIGGRPRSVIFPLDVPFGPQ